ncbi:ADP-ribosylglycohydrolase family protein [Candidatus Methylopumilus turicensis]|uniref:ADP-ribosylglycohydrolase family protein n=1 Tax=Candidatus Methylopumilus turicensis TaxID=1581680 RepID=UPI0005F29351|nr:ADP-ribosylglycohydrolase family protein [Candidatus Methylopumilus turicensis]
MSANLLTKADRMRGLLWGLFIGDALSMPVHWYYDISALAKDFGQIRDYQAPKAHHPNSIMSLANTSKSWSWLTRWRYCWGCDSERKKTSLGSC